MKSWLTAVAAPVFVFVGDPSRAAVVGLHTLTTLNLMPYFAGANGDTIAWTSGPTQCETANMR